MEKSSAPPLSHRSAQAGSIMVLIVGVIAAVGAGKLPAELPLIRQELDMSLMQAGFLVAMFQLSGALMGLFGGALADRFGHRRIMQVGLAVLALGSALGALVASPIPLLASRALESLGFILTVLPAAALLRRLVSPDHMGRWLGLWGAYMPVGFALALLVSPWISAQGGWQGVWLAHAALAIACLPALRRLVPPDPPSAADQRRYLPLLGATLGARGPWLLALCFGAYAGQYLAIVSFLPSVYLQGGIALEQAGALSAGVAGINLFGNIASGQLIHRGVRASTLIIVAASALLIGAWVVFGTDLSFAIRYGVICVTSLLAGLIPGALFVLAPRFAPGAQTVSTTVGLMQQGSGVGQIILPPLVAWVATISGGWHNTWMATGAFAAAAIFLAFAIAAHDKRLVREPAGGAPRVAPS
ncbi:MAG: MFS transporter [Burkholderiaceae bacterium]